MRLGVSAFLLVSLVGRDLFADEGASSIRHTVTAGETCSAIAQRYYGESRLVEVLHRANPTIFTSPPPHVLAEGTVLTVPPRPPTSGGPDANLTTVKNRVEVIAPEPRQGKVNDPLFRGNRVTTEESSAADVTFRDESQVRLGERTLVIILGDTGAAASRSALPEARTSLVTGNLRAWMSSGGKKPSVTAIDTPAAEVRVTSGEASVSSDVAKTTRLAVHAGTSTITAARTTREVTRGFGAKAELGHAPSSPRPLPTAPTWRSLPTPVLVDLGAPLSITGAYDLDSAVKLSKWHVQVSADEHFRDVVADLLVAPETKRFDVQPKGPGRYFIRISAIDDDRFEGPFSRSARVLVVRFTATPIAATASSPARRVVVIEPSDAPCVRVGNKPLEWIRGPLTGSLHEPFRFRCAPFELDPTTLVDIDKLR